MKVKEIYLKNYGPISEITVHPKVSESGHHVPIAIVGQNGAGKSLTLSSVLDAMTEARRSSFASIQEVPENNYIKVSSKNYIQNIKKYSHTRVLLSTSDGDISFNEVVSKLSLEEFCNANPIPDLLDTLKNDEFKNSGFYKKIAINDIQKKSVQNSLFLYFPYFRYEISSWMNDLANVNFIKSDNHYGKSKLNPIRTNIIEETKRWILNVLLDRELYERRIGPPVAGSALPTFLGYQGPNTKLFSLVNEIVSTMLSAKNPKISAARIGVGRKGNREIAVMATKLGEQEEVIAPDISQMSSGELMTLGLATEIIRSYELIKGAPPENLDEVSGVVLVDEIDLHLHVSFQKAVLPKIIRKFPNVQFILTTHSPFFLLGMSETGPIDIYNMPIGAKITPEEFEEFQASYDVFMQKNEQFRLQYDQLKTQADTETKPLIITEGKTDWIHMKSALKKLKLNGKFQLLDIDFFEYKEEIEMGDTRLSQMCEHISALPQRRKMIFVFDRDNPSINKLMSGHPESFKSLGNNVYSMCLPVPDHRKEYKNLNIELYYTEDTLHSFDPASNKRLWFSNEIEIVTRPTSGNKIYRTIFPPNPEDELGKKVFDQPAHQIVNERNEPVGLSKAAFSELIAKESINTNASDMESFIKLFSVIENISTT